MMMLLMMDDDFDDDFDDDEIVILGMTTTFDHLEHQKVTTIYLFNSMCKINILSFFLSFVNFLISFCVCNCANKSVEILFIL